MSSFAEKKSFCEKEREGNIRRNEELLRRFGIFLREIKPTSQQKKEYFATHSESESAPDSNPTQVPCVPGLLVPYVPGLLDSVSKELIEIKSDENEEISERKKVSCEEYLRKRDVILMEGEIALVRQQKLEEKLEITNEFETLSIERIEISSDEDEEISRSKKVSCEEYLIKREDVILMEEEIALVRQQKLEEKLEITNEFETLSIERIEISSDEDEEISRSKKVSCEEYLIKREDVILMEEEIALVRQQKLEEKLEITNEFETLSIERIEISSDEDEEISRTKKVSYEEYLRKREDVILMEEEITLVSIYTRQQKLEENLEIPDSKEITNEFETLSIERSGRHLKPVVYTEEELTT